MTGDRIERLRADATTPAAVESGEATVWTADVHAALDEVDRLRAERNTAMAFLPHYTCGGDADHCTVCDLKRRVADRG